VLKGTEMAYNLFFFLKELEGFAPLQETLFRGKMFQDYIGTASPPHQKGEIRKQKRK
jgi:hypothetical protein